MLIGEYPVKITNGKRIAFPKKLRSLLGDLLIVTQGYEGCLVIVNREQFENLTQGVAEQPFILGDVRETSRFLLANAYEIELDDQGRFVLPVKLKDYAKVNEEVVFLGLGRWVEVWDRARWEKHEEELKGKAGEISERLGRLET